MEFLLILWPITGWLCAFLSTSGWMFREDPAGILLAIVCGALVGPFGVLWFFMKP
jgi:hypothetical protein